MLLYGENGTKTEHAAPRIAHHFNIQDLPGDPACKTVLLITHRWLNRTNPVVLFSRTSACAPSNAKPSASRSICSKHCCKRAFTRGAFRGKL